ncbi:hypothetical protein ABZW10_36715 [Kitasatospora sp. NPDC004723]|uniref:hypothetical protein n=1 Tax=Kitasatospora sp. NPDC004723 TaxID=3154288 RepID=UPI0033B3A1C3
MSDPLTAPAAVLLAEAYTWHSAALRDLVLELLDDADPDNIASDTVDDLCAELWLHAAGLLAVRSYSYTELLDVLDLSAEILVNRLQHQLPVRLAGRLATAADAVDVAELAAAATDHGPLPRPRSRWALRYMSALHTAA